MPAKPVTIGLVLLLVVGAGTYVAVTSILTHEPPPYFKGGHVGIPGGTTLTVEDVEYDANAHRVSFRIVFDAGEPTESIHETIRVMQFDLSDETISETKVTASRVTGSEADEVVWNVEDYALTPGLIFFGCSLKGRWVGAKSGESPLDGSIGGFWQL